ncbi:MAG: FtsK/SpoIIIE domain-containing protein, partial [Rhodomicrobium sp.]
AQEGLVNLADRFQAGRSDLPYIVLVFDEFADLILAGRSEKKEFEAAAARIAGKGRAAGIHLVLATQRPDRTVVTGLIKSNLPMKVCLRVTNATNSQIVLDELGAESLLGRGDLLCDMGKGIIRAQSYFVPQADFLKALGSNETR